MAVSSLLCAQDDISTLRRHRVGAHCDGCPRWRPSLHPVSGTSKGIRDRLKAKYIAEVTDVADYKVKLTDIGSDIGNQVGASMAELP